MIPTIMDSPVYIVWSFIEQSIDLKRVNDVRIVNLTFNWHERPQVLFLNLICAAHIWSYTVAGETIAPPTEQPERLYKVYK